MLVIRGTIESIGDDLSYVPTNALGVIGWGMDIRNGNSNYQYNLGLTNDLITVGTSFYMGSSSAFKALKGL